MLCPPHRALARHDRLLRSSPFVSVTPFLRCELPRRSVLNRRVTCANAGRHRHGADADLKTIADLPFHAMGRFPKAAGDRPVPRPGDGQSTIDGLSSQELFERIRDLSLGSRARSASGRRSRRDHRGEPARMDHVRHGDPGGRRRHGADLSHALRGAGPLHPPGLRRAPRDRVDARRSSTSCRKSGTCCRRSRRSSSMERRRAGPGASVMTLDEVAQRGHARMTGEWGAGRGFRDAARAVRSRRPCDDHLHLGDDGRAQGCDAHAREPRREPARGGHGARRLPGRRRAVVPPAQPRRSSGWSRSFICSTGVTIVFAESFDTLGRDIARVRPTVITGVPRVYEKMQARILEKGQAGSAAKAAVFRWSINAGLARARAMLRGSPAGPLTALKAAIADRLVFSTDSRGRRAAGSGWSRPAARRCRRAWRSSFMPSGCRSSKATA